MATSYAPNGLPIHFIFTGYDGCGYSGVSDPEELHTYERFDTEEESWDVAPRCAAPAAYIAVSNQHLDNETELCAEHAAHVRGCPSCSQYLVSMRPV